MLEWNAVVLSGWFPAYLKWLIEWTQAHESDLKREITMKKRFFAVFLQILLIEQR